VVLAGIIEAVGELQGVVFRCRWIVFPPPIVGSIQSLFLLSGDHCVWEVNDLICTR